MDQALEAATRGSVVPSTPPETASSSLHSSPFHVPIPREFSEDQYVRGLVWVLPWVIHPHTGQACPAV